MFQIIGVTSVEPEWKQSTSNAIMVPYVVEPVVDDQTFVLAFSKLPGGIVDSGETGFFLQRQGEILRVSRFGCTQSLLDRKARSRFDFQGKDRTAGKVLFIGMKEKSGSIVVH
jgi:hypothetical protein